MSSGAVERIPHGVHIKINREARYVTVINKCIIAYYISGVC